MNNLPHNYHFILGDVSGDGHSQTETIYFRSNKTGEEMDVLSKESDKVFGINYFDKVADEYEEPYVPERLVEKMKELGHYNPEWFSEATTREELEKEFEESKKLYPQQYQYRTVPENTHTVCQETFLELKFQLMKYVDPTFEWEFCENKTPRWMPMGGWCGNCAYGLFH